MSNIIISPESGILEFNNNSPSGAAIGSVTAPIRLDATGGNSFITGSNFGIGTSEPQFTLDVDGAIHGTSGNFQTAITVGGNPVMTGVNDRDTDTLQTVTERGATSNQEISVSNIVTANQFNVGNEGKVNSSSTVGLQLQSTSTNKPIKFLTNVAGQTERMRIEGDGKVGIGTTSPDSKLHVVGSADSDAASFGSEIVASQTASGTNWSGSSIATGYTHTAGSADILSTTLNATTNKLYRVEIETTNVTAGRLDKVSFGGIETTVYITSNLTRVFSVKAISNGPLTFECQSGFVGTVTVSSVKEIVASDSLFTLTNSGGNRLETRVFGTTDFFLGDSAGENRIEAPSSGNNIGIGNFALQRIATAGINLAIGNRSLSNLTNGQYNVAIGHDILGNYQKNGNVYNIGIGNNVMDGSSMTGSSNIIMGFWAGANMTSAGSNLGIGYSVFGNLTSGSSNLSLGNYSLRSATSGGSNIALGDRALYSLTTTHGNIAIGNLAGRYAIGNAANETPSQSIYIGYNTKAAANGETNQIVIGYNAEGIGANTVTLGNDSVVTTALKGNVGIGTTSPNVKLHVEDTSSTSPVRAYNGSHYAAIGANSNAAWIQAGGSPPHGLRLSAGANGAMSVYASRGVAIGEYPTTDPGADNFTVAGSVGIGTTSPSEKLDVQGNVKLTGNLNVGGYIHPNDENGNLRIFGGNDTTNDAQILLHGNADSWGSLEFNYGYDATNSFLKISQGSNEHLRITNGGKVGIGTTSPAWKLEVDGTSKISPSTSEPALYLDRVTGQPSIKASTTDGYMIIDSSSNYLSLNHYVNKDVILANGGGDVGIRTTSPSADLHVNGDVQIGSSTSANSYGALQVNQTSNVDEEGIGVLSASAGRSIRIWVDETRSYINSGNGGSGILVLNEGAGNVGIGTTSPRSGLDIGDNDLYIGNHPTTRKIYFGNSSNYFTRGGIYTTQTNLGLYNNYSTGYITLNTDSGEAVRIAADGNVGIGITNPTVKLHVDGGINVAGHILPTTDNSFDLGSTNSLDFRTLYIREIDVFNQRLRIDYTGTTARFQDHSSVGDGFQFLHLGTEILRLGNDTSTTATFAGDVTVSGGDITLGGTGRIQGIDTVSASTDAANKAYVDAQVGSADTLQEVTDNGNTTTNNIGIGTTSPDRLLHLEKSSSTSGEELLRLENPNTDGKLTKIGFITSGLIQPQTQIFGGNDNSGQGGQAGNSGAGKFKVTISNPSGTHQEVIYAQNDSSTANKYTSLSSGGSEIMRLKADGNVGIGTTSPSSVLEVVDSSTSATARGIIIRNTASSNDPDFRIGVGYSGMYDDSLTIFKDSTILQYLTDQGTFFTQPIALASSKKIKAFNSGLAYLDIYNGSANTELSASTDLIFKTTGTERVRIKTSSGNVGIGTNNPDHELQVKGDISIDNENSSVPSLLHFNATNKTNLDPTSRICFWEGDQHSADYTTSNAFIEYNGSAAGGGDGYLAIGGVTNAGSNQDIMILNRLGRVGIGTTSPYTTLQVGNPNDSVGISTNVKLYVADGGIRVGSTSGSDFGYRFFRDSSSGDLVFIGDQNGNTHYNFQNYGGTSLLRIKNDGNVGIGTTNPTSQLQVDTPATSSIGNGIRINRPAAGTHYHALEFSTDGTCDWSIGQNVADALEIYENGADSTTRLTILEGGNVGIGSISPDHKLRVGDGNICIDSDQAFIGNRYRSFVASNTNIQLNNTTDMQFNLHNAAMDFKFGLQGSTPFVTIGGDGKVGIGTTSPAQKLVVSGSTSISSNLYIGGLSSTGTRIQADSGQIRGYYTTSTDARFHLGRDAFASGSAGLAMGGSGGYSAIGCATSGNDLLFSTNMSAAGQGAAAERMRIDSSGNVGIGTTSPSYKLHVSGTVGLTNQLYFTNNTAQIQVGSAWNTGVLNFLNGPTTAIQFDIPNNRIRNNLGKYLTDSGTTGEFGTLNNNSVAIVANNSTKMTILTDGNVGIGTASPTDKLEVYANGADVALRIHEDAGTHQARLHLRRGGSDWEIINDNNLTIESEGSEKMRITTTGNVGIGTTSPSYKLSVSGGDFGVPNGSKVYIGGAVGDSVIGYLGNTSGKFTLNSDGNRDVIIGSGTVTDAVFIKGTNGHVGIGTNSPATNFHVDGNVVFSESGDHMRLRLVADATDQAIIYFGDPANNYQGRVAYQNSNDSLYFTTDGAEKMRILSGGNVGIGTANPDHKLHIKSTGWDGLRIESTTTSGAVLDLINTQRRFSIASRDNSFQVRDITASDTPRLTIKSDGKVGIGTVSPQEKLDISGGNIRLDDGQRISWSTADANIGRVRIVGNESSDFLAFTTDNSERLRINSSGNVGIGTTGPITKLHVEGNTPVIQIRETSGTAEAGISMNHSVSGNHYNWFVGTLDGSPRKLTIGATVTDGHSTNTAQAAASLMLLDQSTGNVGIGTANPTAKLHISENSGQVRIGSPTTSYGGVGFAGSLTAANAALFGTATTTIIGAAGGGFIEMKLGNDAVGNGSLKMEADKLYYTDGNFGIGTTSPSQKLDVQGTILVNNEIQLVDSNMRIFRSSNDLRLRTGGSDRVTIDSSGDVGIGTTSPNTKLEIAGSSSDGVLVSGGSNNRNTKLTAHGLVYSTTSTSGWAMGNYVVKNSDGSTLGQISGGFGGANALTYTYYGGTAYDNAAMYILSSNKNVGIGTASPEQKLHVYQGATKLESTNGDDFSLQLGRSDNANLWNFNHAGNDLRIYNNGGNGYDVLIGVNSGGTVINNKVGIATGSPSYRLDIGGAVSSSSNTIRMVQASGGTAIRIGAGGGSNDVNLLRVDGNSTAAGNTGVTDSSNYGFSLRYKGSGSGADNSLAFFADNSNAGSQIEALTILNNGNIGIGVTSPSYSLQVGGSIVGSSKSFLIKHPTKEGKQLLHACIEGPENGVYFRGKSTSSILEMPDYWIGLVHIDSMTVDITAIGPNQDLYVESIADDGEVTIGSNTEEPLNYFYVIYGERKDIDKLEIEILAPEYAN